MTGTGDTTPRTALPYCSQPVRPEIPLSPDLSFERQRAILLNRTKWVNGTVLHYFFFADGDWSADRRQSDRVRQAFGTWKELGIGLEFKEVDSASEAEIRIGFAQDDGSWSYVGRDVLDIGIQERTMNFGWDLTDEYGMATALHEIGHTLGFAHEHQNPFAGIVWDEEAVYRYLGGPPNNWPRQTTFHNVLRKLSPQEVSGSTWDPDSIMEYGFPADLILQPEEYRAGIRPSLRLSALDREYVLRWYPPLEDDKARQLSPFQSAPLSLRSGEQENFEIRPEETRRYRLGAFGDSDTVLVVFEDVDGELRYLAGDDDSGQDRNSTLEFNLRKGHRYVARIRLYSAWSSGNTAIMLW
ncbi:M12 family metallopeptidase [Planobispora takensis]|uniref:Peptidase metallopeptidase domain-containing protein n=1 Tax=Planobispora takensis TaxID=1367882 RepID=A0A8J3T1Q4_9ACTN|nr:M12 family metallopeptidase [Planobispora takensis]GII04138.1 hypothetical protein Pta02_61460 [Planobispora takensis]